MTANRRRKKKKSKAKAIFDRVIFFILGAILLIGGINIVITKEYTELRTGDAYSGDQVVWIGIVFICMSLACLYRTFCKFEKTKT